MGNDRISFRHLRGKMSHALDKKSEDLAVGKEDSDGGTSGKKLSLADMKPASLQRNRPPSPGERLSELRNRKMPAEAAEAPPLKDSILFRRSRDYEDYLNDYLEKYGLSAELYEQMRIFYASAGDVAALERVWKRLPELGMSESDGWLERAEVLRQMGKMELALQYLEKNQRANTSDPHANYALGMFYKLERDYELAVHWLNKWQRLDPNNPEVYYHLGAIYRRIRSDELARRNLLECLRLFPRHMAAKALLDKLG